MIKCFISFKQEDNWVGFKANVKSINDLNKRLLTKCHNALVTIEEFDNVDPVVFESMPDINSYFDDPNDLDYLYILKDDAWYCRAKNSNEFKDIRLIEKEATNDNSIDVVRYEVGKLKDKVEVLNTTLNEFKTAYYKEQKLSFYSCIAIVILLGVVGVIAIFR